MNDYATHRARVAHLLDLSEDTLTEAGRDRIRHAVKHRHDDWCGYLENTEARDVGVQLVRELGSADAALTPEQVEQLEAITCHRLAPV
jgi:hypothetical protein